MVSSVRCCQELYRSPRHSPGVQGTGMFLGKRPWYHDTPLGSRIPSALLSWCCSHAEPRHPGVSVTASASTTAGLGWAGVGMESPEEQEGYKTRAREIPVWRPTAGVPLALSWAADGHTRFRRRSRGACSTLLTRAHLPEGVLQAKAQPCWLPRRAELSWKSKYGAPGPPTPASRAAVLWDTSSTHLKPSRLQLSRWAAAGLGCPSAKGNSSEMLPGETGECGRKGNIPSGLGRLKEEQVSQA